MEMQLIWSATKALFIFFLSSIVESRLSVLEQVNLASGAVPDLDVDEFIGCLHEDVCNSDEVCFNDGLFGRCLAEEKARLVSSESDKLVPNHLSTLYEILPNLPNVPWHSLEIQCRIRSLMLSLRLNIPLSIDTCDSLEESPFLQDHNLLDGINGEIRKAKPKLFIPEPLKTNPVELNSEVSIPEENTSVIENKIRSDDVEILSGKLIWLDFESPLKSEAEAEKISESVVKNLHGDLESLRYVLSPSGKNIMIKMEKSDSIGSEPEILNRLKRFADSNLAQKVSKYGVGRQKMDQQISQQLSGAVMIGVSVCIGILVVILAVSTPFIVRNYRNSTVKTGKDDDEEFLADAQNVDGKLQQDASEVVDILGPLVNEAKKSAQNLIAGASGYFANLGKQAKEDFGQTGKMMKKQISNSSITSVESSRRNNSTSSWSDEPVKMDIDISTGHLILNYLEQHLNNQCKLSNEWDSICNYQADDVAFCEAATKQGNLVKNRPGASLPYEQSRVKLRSNGGDYINASLIFDHEPRNPSYIATQSPMKATIGDFWQMVWDQSSVTIVALDQAGTLLRPDDPLVAEDPTKPIQYWPEEGWQQCGQFEVNLVSEHMFCGKEYVVRSFYLRNSTTNETRTVTQFHFVEWPMDSPLAVVNSMLEFRRRINKSFRGKCSPIIVHCPDGSGVSGAYLLLDMVLNRIQRGIKEFDIAATVEHLRDQRQGMVQTKKQFEFVLTAVAEEVNSLLKCPN